MYGNSVSFKDYEGIQGFGSGSQSQVDELNKALSAGSANPPLAGGDSLRVESLEATLRTVTYTLQNIKLWPSIPKLPAFSTVEEYNILSSYGDDGGVFNPEGTLPEIQDSTYARKTALVKFLGTTREVTHVMSMVRPAHGNVVAMETQNGAVYLVEKLERALYGGDSGVVSQEFDGIEKQMLDGVGITAPFDGTTDPVENFNSITIDMRGDALTEDAVEEASNRILENYGTPSSLHLAPRANSDLSKAFFPRERVNLPAPANGRVGLAVSSVVTGGGAVDLKPNVFLRPGRNNGGKQPPENETSAKAPAAPTITSAAAAASTGVISKFTTANANVGAANAYFYKVTAVNRFGESAATAIGSALTVTNTQMVQIVIAASVVTGDEKPTGYRIYRGDPGGLVGTCKLMCTVPTDASATTIYDKDFWKPSCSRAYMFQDNLQFYSFRQLAPMMKIPLATMGPSIRWMQLLYGTPIVYAPRKSCIFINVKDD